jgi:ornithine--oxo-acid transaminase
MTTHLEPRSSAEHIELVERHSAHNYHPLPVVIAQAEGVWVTDVEGNATSTCSPRTRR